MIVHLFEARQRTPTGGFLFCGAWIFRGSWLLRRSLLLFGLVCGAAITGACGTPVELTGSNKDRNYQSTLSRVLVTKAFFLPDMSDTHRNAFIRTSELQKSLEASWGPLGVSVEVVDLDRTRDRRTVVNDATATFHPTHQLNLTTTEWHKASSLVVANVVTSYAVDASLVDVATGKRVWRATLAFQNAAVGGRWRNGPTGAARPHEDDANDLVALLTARLKADGLLR
jgi:hypothetical protein